MEKYLPWVSIALALAAFVLRLGFGSQKQSAAPLSQSFRESLVYLIGLAVVCLAAGFCGWKYGKSLEGLTPAAIGFAVGALSIYVVHLLGASAGHSPWSLATTFAFPAAALASTHWLKTTAEIPAMQLGAVVGAMVAAFLFGIAGTDESRRSAQIGAVFLGVCVTADYMGREAAGGNLALTGVAFGAVAAFTAIVAALLASQGGKVEIRTNGFVWVASALVLLILGAVLVGYKFMSVKDIVAIYAVTAAIAVVVHWFLPEGHEGTTRFALAAAIWLAAATGAFLLRRGFGMSVCLVSAFTMLALLGNRKALATLGPLAAMVFCRIFIEAHPDSSKALDIGPMYAMIGVLAGAVLPLIVIEWQENSKKSMICRGLCAGLVVIALAVGVPVAGVLLLGPKGVVGYVAVLGLAAVIQGLRGSKSLSALYTAIGLAATMTLAYGWVVDFIDLTRDQRAGILGRILLDVLALALLAAFLSREKKEERTA